MVAALLTEIKFSRLLLYSKHPVYGTKSLCILKRPRELIFCFKCVCRDLFPDFFFFSFSLDFFGGGVGGGGMMCCERCGP